MKTTNAMELNSEEDVERLELEEQFILRLPEVHLKLFKFKFVINHCCRNKPQKYETL